VNHRSKINQKIDRRNAIIIPNTFATFEKMKSPGIKSGTLFADVPV
jgi:hypothetical protein